MAATAIRNTLKVGSRLKGKGTKLAKETADKLSLKASGEIRNSSIKHASKNIKNNIEGLSRPSKFNVDTSSLSPKDYIGDLAGETRPVKQMVLESNRLHQSQMDLTYKDKIRSTANNLKNTESSINTERLADPRLNTKAIKETITPFDNANMNQPGKYDKMAEEINKDIPDLKSIQEKRRNQYHESLMNKQKEFTGTTYEKSNKGKGDKSWWDNQVDKGIPQAVGGTIGLAYLVSSMSDRRGQQSNSELYGQKTPYR